MPTKTEIMRIASGVSLKRVTLMGRCWPDSDRLFDFI
jgi:hypothetical protein